MQAFNVIAIGGSGIANLVGNLVNIKYTHGEKPSFRGYMDPGAPTIEVDEETKLVNYNGNSYQFVEYRSGIHGYAKIVAFKVRGVLIEAYTDTPAIPGTSREQILASLKRRKENPHSGY